MPFLEWEVTASDVPSAALIGTKYYDCALFSANAVFLACAVVSSYSARRWGRVSISEGE